jgi:hypothetical protein
LATYHAIAATGQAIVSLLADASRDTEFAGVQFTLYQASNFQKPMDEGVSLYLYRVSINTVGRNQPPSVGPNGQRARPTLPLNLHYLLTAWAQTAARQQLLLGWAMRILEDTPIMPVGLLNQNHFGPAPGAFRPSEQVEIVWEQLSIQDMASIWEVYKSNQQISPQLSATYQARMVAIESTAPMTVAREVQTRVFDVGTVSSK